ncbi:MAG: hypothetical protein K2H15_08415, partial [Muribaculaceae bacterium]|nr:hypothetical protein [Muribaculaceae bacterium]
SSFTATAIKDGSTLPEGTVVSLPTGMLYGTVLHHVTHTKGEISIDGKPAGSASPPTLILTPDSLSTQYTLRIGPISIPPTLKKMSVWISGTGDSMTISDGVVQGDTAVPFENLSFRDDIVTGSTTAFGGRKDDFQKYGLTFRFQDDYGRTFYKNIDITEIVVNSEWSHNVYIDIGDIDFSDTIGGNTDFGNPIGVDGWENIDTDYVIYFP